MSEKLYEFREAKPADHNFIHRSWYKSLQKVHPYKLIDKQIYHRVYSAAIFAILRNSQVATIVANFKEDPNLIFGYSVIQGPHLHYVYVKPSWRKQGIAKELLPPGLISFSHYSPEFQPIWDKNAKLIFNPFF